MGAHPCMRNGSISRHGAVTRAQLLAAMLSLWTLFASSYVFVLIRRGISTADNTQGASCFHSSHEPNTCRLSQCDLMWRLGPKPKRRIGSCL